MGVDPAGTGLGVEAIKPTPKTKILGHQ